MTVWAVGTPLECSYSQSSWNAQRIPSILNAHFFGFQMLEIHFFRYQRHTNKAFLIRIFMNTRQSEFSVISALYKTSPYQFLCLDVWCDPFSILTSIITSMLQSRKNCTYKERMKNGEVYLLYKNFINKCHNKNIDNQNSLANDTIQK